MENLTYLIVSLIGIFVCSISFIFFIWISGLAIVITLNTIFGLYLTWNLLYSILTFAIIVIVFVALSKKKGR